MFVLESTACLYTFVKMSLSVVVDFLFIVTPIVGVCNCSMFCYTLLCVRSSIAIILMGKKELVALLNLSSWCTVMVERLFLAVPQVCLRFVIVVFPDHTHLLLFTIRRKIYAVYISVLFKKSVTYEILKDKIMFYAPL